MFVPFGLLWGAFIFWADRSIIGEPKYGKKNKEVLGTSRVRWIRYLARALLAVGAAFLVAEAATLLVFDAEVESKLGEVHQQQKVDARRAAFENEREERALLVQQREDLDTDLNTAIELERRAAQDLQAEAHGTGGSGQEGYGPISESLQGQLAQRTEELRLLRDDQKPERDRIETALAELATHRDEAIRDREVEIDSGTGWLAREHALHLVLEENADVRLWSWLLRATLLLIDLLPLSLKLFTPRTLYDQLVETEAEIVLHEAQEGLKAGKRAVELEIESEEARRMVGHTITLDQIHREKMLRMNASGSPNSYGNGYSNGHGRFRRLARPERRPQ